MRREAAIDMNKEHTKRSKQLAVLLDSKFTIPGTNIRFGIDPILGLIPGAGDWLAGIISIYFIFLGILEGGNSAVLIRMFLNILLDIIFGSIPVIGEVFDVAWKANLRNARLLDELAKDPRKTEAQSRWFNWILFIIFVLIILGLLVAISWLIIEIVEWLFSLGS